MKKLLFLTLTLTIMLWACNDDGETNNSTSATIHVKIINNMTYNGQPEGIRHILFYDAANNSTGLISMNIPSGNSYERDVYFNFLGYLKCAASTDNTAMLIHAPYKMVNVVKGQSLTITFDQALP